MKLSQEEKRIKIAGVCKFISWHSGFPFWRKNDSPFLIDFDPLSDLNAMHEAEKKILFKPKPYSMGANKKSQKWNEFNMKLTQIIAGDLGGWGKHFLNAIALLTHATAAQRAEAFGLTLGLWKQGE